MAHSSASDGDGRLCIVVTTTGHIVCALVGLIMRCVSIIHNKFSYDDHTQHTLSWTGDTIKTFAALFESYTAVQH